MFNSASRNFLESLATQPPEKFELNKAAGHIAERLMKNGIGTRIDIGLDPAEIALVLGKGHTVYRLVKDRGLQSLFAFGDDEPDIPSGRTPITP